MKTVPFISIEIMIWAIDQNENKNTKYEMKKEITLAFLLVLNGKWDLK